MIYKCLQSLKKTLRRLVFLFGNRLRCFCSGCPYCSCVDEVNPSGCWLPVVDSSFFLRNFSNTR